MIASWLSHTTRRCVLFTADTVLFLLFLTCFLECICNRGFPLFSYTFWCLFLSFSLVISLSVYLSLCLPVPFPPFSIFLALSHSFSFFLYSLNLALSLLLFPFSGQHLFARIQACHGHASGGQQLYLHGQVRLENRVSFFTRSCAHLLPSQHWV